MVWRGRIHRIHYTITILVKYFYVDLQLRMYWYGAGWTCSWVGRP
eukprot:SAG22_NODE_572_length_9005_cov_105.428138_1_plen_45_part_00